MIEVKMIKPVPFIDHEVTMEQVRFVAGQTGGIIYYAIRTPWWTANPNNLYKYKGLPCDPRGSKLMQTSSVLTMGAAGTFETGYEKFLQKAEKHPNHYGKYGVRTFLLAYHGCVRIIREKDGKSMPTSLNGWIDYEKLLDGLIASENNHRLRMVLR